MTLCRTLPRMSRDVFLSHLSNSLIARLDPVISGAIFHDYLAVPVR